MVLPVMVSGEPAQEGDEPQAEAIIVEKSDEVVVPKKLAKTWVTPVESVEGRTEAKGKSAAENASSTQRETEVLSFLQRIGERAKTKGQVDQLFDARFPLPQPRIYHPWPTDRFALRRP